MANNAIPALADLLPPEPGAQLRDECSGLNTGASLLTVYFGFDRPLRELGYSYYSTFIYDTSVKSQADIAANNRDDFARRSFTFVDYGQVDSGLTSAGKDVGAVCCIDYPDDWENLGKKEYEQKKEYVAQAFIGRLEEVIPGFKDVIGYYEVGTPLTVKRYTLNPGGAVYGFAQNPGRKIPLTPRAINQPAGNALARPGRAPCGTCSRRWWARARSTATSRSVKSSVGRSVPIVARSSS